MKLQKTIIECLGREHLDPGDSTLRAFLGSLVTVVPQESFTFSG